MAVAGIAAAIYFYRNITLVKLLIETILTYISNFSALLAICIGWRSKHILWYYALASFAFDVNGFVLKTYNIERYWASNIFIAMEFVLLTLYFINTLIPIQHRKILYGFMTMITLYFIADTIIKSVWKANYVTATILYAIYLCYCMCGFYKVIREAEYTHIEKNPLFIFCVAFLLYASGSIIIFLFKDDSEFITNVWHRVRNPLNIIKNLLLAYGFWLVKQKK